MQIGDLLLEVAGAPVSGLAGLFRSIWRLGNAGVEVTLTIGRKGEKRTVRLRSADRNDFLKKRTLQ